MKSMQQVDGTAYNPTLEGGTIKSPTITRDATTDALPLVSGVTVRHTGGTAIDGDGGDTQAATITAAAIASGTVLYDCNGGASTGTFDTPANIQSACGLTAVGDSFEVVIFNASDAAEDLTLAFTGNNLATNLGADLVLTQGEAAVIRVIAGRVGEGSESNRIIVFKD